MVAESHTLLYVTAPRAAQVARTTSTTTHAAAPDPEEGGREARDRIQRGRAARWPDPGKSGREGGGGAGSGGEGRSGGRIRENPGGREGDGGAGSGGEGWRGG